MLEHIESIREIMEFSDDPDEIRTMCEWSSGPKSLVDAVIGNLDNLDELEKAAAGRDGSTRLRTTDPSTPGSALRASP